MKKFITNIVDKDIKSIATFCMITFITAVFFLSPQVDNTIRIFGLVIYLLYSFSFLFGKIKTILIHSISFYNSINNWSIINNLYMAFI